MNEYEGRSFRLLKRFQLVKITTKLLKIKDKGFTKYIKESKKNDELLDKYTEFKVKNNAIDIVVDTKININKVNEDLKELNYNYNLFKLENKKSKKENVNQISYNFLTKYFKYRTFILISNRKKDISQFYYCKNIIYSKNLKQEIENLINTLEGLKYIANYNDKNNITVKTSTFFNYKGTNYYSGGAERYLVDLYQVSSELGYNLNIYQIAEKPFFRKYRGINVIGLANKDEKINASTSYVEKQTENYNGATKYFSSLHIYSAFYEAYPKALSPSIGISHGVAWDNPYSVATDGIDFWVRNLRIIESAKMCDKLVSVDTNTANWFQTIDYKLGNKRIKVVPNYVDTEEFKFVNNKKTKEKIIITYPRRLYEPRGMYLLLDIVDELISKHKNIEIHFVGKGFDKDINSIKNKIKKYPKQIFCYSSEPEKMYEVYQKSDISLIPTLYSEGTSLSCLEAMATGNIVVATRVGGLTDLIINKYNGYLIEPTKEDLLNTLLYIIENIEGQDKIKKRARETAEVFNKEVWKEKWKEMIKSFNLKQKSKNIDLIEFYVKDAEKINSKIIDKIKEELLKNQLIYIKSEKNIKIDKISGGLIQLVPFDEEIVTTAKKIYAEKGINLKIKGNIEKI